MMLFDYISQLFADEAETEAETTEAAAETEAEQEEEEPKPFDKRYTDADLNRIINAKFARWQREQAKKISEAQRLAQMTEEERTKAERDALQKELDELKRQTSLAEMQREARKLLNAEGISVGDELVDMLVSDDAEKTNAAIKKFSEAYKAAVQDGVRQALKGKAPSKSTTTTAKTKEEILKVQDAAERQKLIRENLKLFIGA